MKIFTSILFLTSVLLHFGTSSFNGYGFVVNYGSWTDPTYGVLDVIPGRKLVGNRMMNVISGTLTFFEEMTCDFQVKYAAYQKVRGSFVARPTLEAIMTIGELGKMMSGVGGFEMELASNLIADAEQCMGSTDFSKSLSCPVQKGSTYNVVDCLFSSNYRLPAKIWNITWQVSTAKGHVVQKAWMEFELDNSQIERLKRPSTVQRRMRDGYYRNKTQLLMFKREN